MNVRKKLNIRLGLRRYFYKNNKYFRFNEEKIYLDNLKNDIIKGIFSNFFVIYRMNMELNKKLRGLF